jgi:hypothetical protein
MYLYNIIMLILIIYYILVSLSMPVERMWWMVT